MLGEGLQQINHTLLTVKANLNKQVHISNVTTSTAAPSLVAPTAPANTSSVTPNVTTSSPVNSTVAMASSASVATQTFQSTLTMMTTFSISVSNSLEQAVTTTIEVHSPVIAPSSSPTIISPSPTYSEGASMEEINLPSLIILSTGEMPSSVELLSTSVAVTSPVVIDKTTEMMNDINALES